jgi:hypothetical protein
LRRSLEIVELAMRGDNSALQRFVSASARFTIWNGDAGGAVGGAIEFARRLDPTGFEYAFAYPGPISLYLCGTMEVTVTFTGSGQWPANIVRFRYERGRLVEAFANTALLARGAMPRN